MASRIMYGTPSEFARMSLAGARTRAYVSSARPKTSMQRDPSSLMHVVLRCLTLAITLVVGVRVGPQVTAGPSPASAVSLADPALGEDAIRPAPRVELRGMGAPAFERLALVAPSYRVSVASLPVAIAEARHVVDIRARGEQRPIVKHVPRLERGDPPRA
jgi:hypothetical protein